MKNFWQELKKNKKGQPILVLAPLAGFTDSAFRLICREYGADVVYSEMASVSALNYNPSKTLDLIKFNKKERPYVVQIFGSNKDHFAKAIKIIEKEIKPDGIDINFGCPVKKVLKQGAGSKLMSDLKLSREIIEVALENTQLPLSIKVRTEAFSVDLIKFLKNISDLPISALMIHGRTLKQLFSGPIDTNIIKKSKKYFSGIILANGGVNSLDEVAEIINKTEVDGVGIGRGALGHPWIFSRNFQNILGEDKKRLSIKVALRHLRLAKKNKGELGFNEFKGHLFWYFKDFIGASELRSQIMICKNYIEIENVLKNKKVLV